MEIFAWVLLIFCLVASIFGTLLPGVPGTAIILLGALVHKAIFPSILNGWVIGAVAAIALLGWVVEFIGLIMGTKWGKASKRGLYGAMVGGLVGLFFPPLGFLVGPALGAMVAELAGRRTPEEAVRSGIGAGIGTAFSLILRLGMNIAAVVTIVIDLFVN